MGDPTPQAKSTLPEPGSFRDWDARVFTFDTRVLRALSDKGLANWTALASSNLLLRSLEEGSLVETRLASQQELDELRAADPDAGWVGAVSHARVPFISYPYEWTFSMLQDAALLQLSLTSGALDEGLILKDGSSYNVQWNGARPVFIDIGSFEPFVAGEPWAGYRQFCMLFLYPLMLEAFRGVPFQPWLRGSPDGLPPADFRALLSRRDAFRRGVFRHVFLHSRLERGNAHRSAEVRQDLAAAGLNERVVRANIHQLRTLVGRLSSGVRGSHWDRYRATSSYDSGDTGVKDDFVRRAAGRSRRQLVLDLGCNDGRFSRIASESAELTVAVDSEPSVVDALYRSLRDEGSTSILPLVVDLANPSPALGWRNLERQTMAGRGRPDLVLCLALVHHLSISAGVPLREIVAWLRAYECEVVVEFPHRDDPMVQLLLSGKGVHPHPDYLLETFGALLESSFHLVESVTLPSAARTLYHVRPKQGVPH